MISTRLQSTLVCYAIVVPSLALLTLFVYLPVTWAFVGSLYEFEIGSEAHFVGLSNYGEYLVQDPTALPSLANMMALTLFALAARLSFPLVVARLIYALPTERWRYLYRVIFLAPVVVPGVAVQLIWSGMIFSDVGLLNGLLEGIGLAHWTRGWLADPDTALLAVAFVGFPFVGGFEVLIYYAGFSSIPESVNEASAIDGCSGLQKFFRIDIPMVLSQLKLILILTLIGGVQGFENLFILTRGGPGFETTVPGLWMYYNAFSFQRMGYACAIGVLLFIVIFGLTMLNLRYFKSAEDLQGVR
ncbi:MAG: sugar ABC transporter permease [Gemmatimonadetes bacterium]|nr:sugar ABC transporter permease [Gemmatimonadota bacterium]MBT7863193.1 sugar ABC transporter permease [Gemmatimonadota bacterium]